MALADIYQKATLVQIPSGYKSGTLYSVVPNTADGDFTVTGDPQGEATRVNKDGLIETVAANVPRLDYNPSNPQDPTLLLEPQRTNECLYSKTLSSWSELNGGSLQTITNNDAIAPDGSLTASTITFTGTGTSLLRQFTNKAYTSNKHSSSFYAKKISGNGSVFFGITDTETEFTPTDEWVRYEVNNVTPTDFGTNLFLDLNFDCTAGDKIAVWGMQLEEGTYSTSVIETSGNAVTRTADYCTLTGFSSNLGQTEGVIFLDFENYGQIGTSYGNHFKIESAGNNDRVAIQSDATSLNRLILVINDGSSTFFQPREDISLGRNKIAIKYKSGDIDAYINGVKEQFSTTSFSFANTLNKIYMGQPNKVYQAMIFNEALTDAELQTLTS